MAPSSFLKPLSRILSIVALNCSMYASSTINIRSHGLEEGRRHLFELGMLVFDILRCSSLLSFAGTRHRMYIQLIRTRQGLPSSQLHFLPVNNARRRYAGSFQMNLSHQLILLCPFLEAIIRARLLYDERPLKRAIRRFYAIASCPIEEMCVPF